ncbi:MAG: adenosylcobinamide-phosphate synthase CbiB [Gemmatimonadales bacterium]
MTGTALITACLLEAMLGDPRWAPHPVRVMGSVIAGYERRVRGIARSPTAEYGAGILLAVVLPAAAFCAVWGMLVLAGRFHPTLEVALSVVLAWTTLSARDLVDHALPVRQALQTGALDQARGAVAQIVGRDTAQLSEPDIIRATTETIAESTADGVVAPLFYLALGGPALAMAFKAVSTLDSMVGYRNERFRRFGWASARLDDVANWVPARITAWLLIGAVGIRSVKGARIQAAWSILCRDGHKHPSPNSGRPEAAMAGALGIQLGGTNLYQGRAEARPQLGDSTMPLEPSTITEALTLMWITAALAVILATGWLFL